MEVVIHTEDALDFGEKDTSIVFRPCKSNKNVDFTVSFVWLGEKWAVVGVDSAAPFDGPARHEETIRQMGFGLQMVVAKSRTLTTSVSTHYFTMGYCTRHRFLGQASGGERRCVFPCYFGLRERHVV